MKIGFHVLTVKNSIVVDFYVIGWHIDANTISFAVPYYIMMHVVFSRVVVKVDTMSTPSSLRIGRVSIMYPIVFYHCINWLSYEPADGSALPEATGSEV